MTTKQELAETYAAELTEMARETIDANHFFVLGTSHPDGQPRVVRRQGEDGGRAGQAVHRPPAQPLALRPGEECLLPADEPAVRRPRPAHANRAAIQNRASRPAILRPRPPAPNGG